MDLQPGAAVGKNVTLVEPLDQGGMGTVWVARYAGMKLEVAVKFMHAHLAESDPSLQERFEREVSVLGRIQNAHVVRMLEHGTTEDGTPYLAMERLRGETFVDRLERTGEPLEMEDVAALLSQLTVALEPMHAMGIVHRDLKAENVFLIGGDDSITVKVLDFGCAKTPDIDGIAKLTSAGALVGSPEYMSPEQIVSARDVGPAADHWAVAVLAYVGLVLALPFTGAQRGALFAAVRAGAFEKPCSLRDDLPPEVDAWFAKAFHYDRAQRFPSLRAMTESWQGFLPPSADEPKKSNAVLVTAIASAVVLLLIVAIVIWVA